MQEATRKFVRTSFGTFDLDIIAYVTDALLVLSAGVDPIAITHAQRLELEAVLGRALGTGGVVS